MKGDEGREDVVERTIEKIWEEIARGDGKDGRK